MSHERHPCAIPVPLRTSPRPMAIVLCVNAIELNGRSPSQQRPLPAACRFRGHHSCGGGLVGASGTSHPGILTSVTMQPYRTLVSHPYLCFLGTSWWCPERASHLGRQGAKWSAERPPARSSTFITSA